MISAVIVLCSLMLFAVAVFTLWWMLHAWRTPETLAATKFADPDGTGALSFSLLVPARHEQAVLERTVLRLLESTHPDFEVIVIVGHDDPDTAEVAHRLAALHPEQVFVVTDTHEKKNKPKALNSALPTCRGTWWASSTPRIRSTRTCCRTSTTRSATPRPTWCRAACN